MSSPTIYNTRIGTPSNLTAGGTYDLLLIKFIDSFPESQLAFDIGDTPRKITGIQKVAQLFMKILFTSKGSNVVYPDQGTMFTTYTMGANVVLQDSLLQSELIAEVKSAESQTKAILNRLDDDPASRLASISVIGLDVNNDNVVMYMRLITAAGATASLAIPFPQLDLPLTDEVKASV